MLGGPPRNPHIPNLHPDPNSSTKRRARVRAQTILGDRETTRGSIWAKFRGAFVRWFTIILPTNGYNKTTSAKRGERRSSLISKRGSKE